MEKAGIGCRESIVGLILAGGAGSRMVAGSHSRAGKASVMLAGQTLCDRVAARLEPQVKTLWVSVGPKSRQSDKLRKTLTYTCLEDTKASFRGPLAGLHAGLKNLQHDQTAQWLLICPCDAPFLPTDLAVRLSDALSNADQPHKAVCRVVVAADQHLQPTFSLWHRDLFPLIDEQLHEDTGAGLMRILDDLPHQIVRWPAEQPPAFFNINGPEDLRTASSWLDPQGPNAG